MSIYDVTIEAPGSRGNDASDGIGYDKDGYGKEAGRPDPGSNGGSIIVKLSSHPSNEPGHIIVTGKIIDSNGKEKKINSDYRLREEGLIHFAAIGGDGGNGGRGANGQGTMKLLFMFYKSNYCIINNYLL
jgi:hypothetical protein